MKIMEISYYQLLIALFLTISANVSGFRSIPVKLQSNLISFQQKSIEKRFQSTELNVLSRPESRDWSNLEVADLSLQEYLSPQYTDKNSILWILAGQGFILNLGIIACVLGGFDMQDVFTFSFDSGSMTYMAMLATGLIAFSQLLDRLPIDPFRSIALDTRIFILRLIGRNTSIPGALGTATLLSLGAGVSEELVFRGVLFSFICGLFGPLPAYVFSSVLFGLAHSPVFGANVVLEAIFGAFFAYSYVSSDYNLAVPMGIHFIYDFITIMITWWNSSRDLRQKMDHKLIHIDGQSGRQHDALTKAVFETIDTGGQGYIDPKELELAMRLFGFGPHPFEKSVKGSNELFQEFDKDGDGKLSYEEFSTLMRNGLYQLPYLAK